MKIGLFADAHYCMLDEIGSRRPLLSRKKLTYALDRMNEERVSLIICLGDLINASKDDTVDIENLDTIAGVLSRTEAQVVCTLGNHDLEAFTNGEFEKRTGIKAAPLSLSLGGVRLIFLDANHSSDGNHYQKGQNDWTDSLIPDEELIWLGKELAAADDPVYVFLHQNLDKPSREGDPHIVKNADAVRALLEQSGKVRAVYQGHYHPGLNQRIAGIDYSTLPAMCEQRVNERESFRIIEI